MTISDHLSDFFDKDVILDVAPPVVYIGRLIEANDFFFTLADVDVHEIPPGGVTKEVYVMGARRNGIQPTRKLVKVKQSDVLSLTRLSDVIMY